MKTTVPNLHQQKIMAFITLKYQSSQPDLIDCTSDGQCFINLNFSAKNNSKQE